MIEIKQGVKMNILTIEKGSLRRVFGPEITLDSLPEKTREFFGLEKADSTFEKIEVLAKCSIDIANDEYLYAALVTSGYYVYVFRIPKEYEHSYALEMGICVAEFPLEDIINPSPQKAKEYISGLMRIGYKKIGEDAISELYSLDSK